MPSDPIAPLALYGVARTLEIERERRVETPDGFTWWIAPGLGELRQHARGAAVRHVPQTGDVELVTRAPLAASTWPPAGSSGRRAAPIGRRPACSHGRRSSPRCNT